MFFIGDVHGLKHQYLKLRKKLDCSLQLGDMGIGFPVYPSSMKYYFVVPYDDRHRFIRGNHDNPSVCVKHKYCLPGWGYAEKMDMFWISGGFSIDFQQRTPGTSWWEDEELSWNDLQLAIDKFATVKPRIVVSHECPATAQFDMFPLSRKLQVNNRTKMAMEQMFLFHKPEFQIFGHYHDQTIKVIGETMFVCCGMLEKYRRVDEQIQSTTFEIKGLEWDI